MSPSSERTEKVWNAFLQIDRVSAQERRVFNLRLSDDYGHSGADEWRLNLQQALNKTANWAQFLGWYRDCQGGEVLQKLFGQALFQQVLVGLPEVARAWREIKAAASGCRLALTVIFGRGTEEAAALPLELLHDEKGYAFNHPEAALTRSYATQPAAAFSWADNPKLLFIHAFPEDDVDTEPMETALGELFPDMDVVPQCSMIGLETFLAGNTTVYDGVFLLAHGVRDAGSGMLWLHGPHGGELVDAGRMALALKDRVKSLAFLCSCRSGDGEQETFSGTAQQFLEHIPVVAATQANLPVLGSVALARSFFQYLRDDPRSPDRALARARVWAYKNGERREAWSVPVLLARPPARKPMDQPAATEAAQPRKVLGLPPRKDTYLARESLHQEGLALLRKRRLVSVEGLPGIGKTEIGRELARLALDHQICGHLIYEEVRAGVTVDLLRDSLAVALGVTEPLETPQQLAALLAGKACLLVLDNAEDLMPDPASQSGFADFLDGLLTAPDLRILLTTRWRVGECEHPEAHLDIPPMTPEQTRRLFKDELDYLGHWRSEWEDDPHVERVLAMIDGHPRSLWLIARHFESARVTPAMVADRLAQLKADAVTAPNLLGRADVYETLKDDKKARLKSLAASMDFSFEILEQRHPQAADAFLGLSLFPGGLPEMVARVMVGGSGLDLDQLFRYHLAEWRDERIYYPVPLHWYAERLRKRRGFDTGPWRERAQEGFADFVEYCHTTGETDLVAAAVFLLREEPSINNLMSGFEANGTTSQLARIAAGAANLMLILNRYQTLDVWLKAGLGAAQKLKDQRGKAYCLRCMGDLGTQRSSLAKAAHAYYAALPIYRQIGERLGEANCLQGMGDLAVRRSSQEDAAHAYSTALPIYRQIGARLGEANCLQGMGDLSIQRNALEEAAHAYDTALLIYREIGVRLGEASCLQRMGDLAIRRDALEEAAYSYNAALSIFRELEVSLGEGNCLLGMGDLAIRRDALEDSTRSYAAALNIFLDVEDKRGVAKCHQSMGELAIRRDALDEAAHAYDTALHIYSEVGDRLEEANCLKRMGDLAMRRDTLEEAVHVYNTALAIFRETGARLGEAICLKSMGDLARRREIFGEAAHAYDIALSIFRETGARLEEVDCLQSNSLLALQRGEPQDAFQGFEEVLQIYRQIGNRTGEQSAFCYMARSAWAMKRGDLALVLAEQSLLIGREMEDRFTQSLNLQLQIQIFHAAEKIDALAGTAHLYWELVEEIQDQPGIQIITGLLGHLRDTISPEDWQELTSQAEFIRQQAVAQAAQRLQDASSQGETPET